MLLVTVGPIQVMVMRSFKVQGFRFRGFLGPEKGGLGLNSMFNLLALNAQETVEQARLHSHAPLLLVRGRFQDAA